MSRSVKPPVSAWIVRERKRLGLKPHDLASRLSAMGLPVADGTPRTWEAGRSPSADNIAGLERIFGTRAPESPATSDGAGLSELYLRLDRQAEVIDRLAAAVEALVEAQPTPEDLIELVRSGLLGPVGAAGRGDAARQP